MIPDKVTPGEHAPASVNVIIEIPMRGEPVKYEVDKHSGAMFVDRFMGTAMHYPCNYGYVPQTLSEDGDPVDVLVITPVPLITGSVVLSRPVGMLQMTDESGPDAKILAVPVDALTPYYGNVDTPRDLPKVILDQIAHFFVHYKDLEPSKWVKVEGWVGPEEAKREIESSIERFEATPDKPNF